MENPKNYKNCQQKVRQHWKLRILYYICVLKCSSKAQALKTMSVLGNIGWCWNINTWIFPDDHFVIGGMTLKGILVPGSHSFFLTLFIIGRVLPCYTPLVLISFLDRSLKAMGLPNHGLKCLKEWDKQNDSSLKVSYLRYNLKKTKERKYKKAGEHLWSVTNLGTIWESPTITNTLSEVVCN